MIKLEYYDKNPDKFVDYLKEKYDLTIVITQT